MYVLRKKDGGRLSIDKLRRTMTYADVFALSALSIKKFLNPFCT